MIHHIQKILDKINSWFPSRNHGNQRQWEDIFKILKEKDCLPRILHPAKLSFKNEGDIPRITNRKFLTSILDIQEILKGVFWAKTKGNYTETQNHTKNKEHQWKKLVAKYKRQCKCIFCVLTLLSDLKDCIK